MAEQADILSLAAPTRSAHATAAHLGVQVGQSREAWLQHVPRGALLLHLAPAALELLIQVAPCAAQETCRLSCCSTHWAGKVLRLRQHCNISPRAGHSSSLSAGRHKLHARGRLSPWAWSLCSLYRSPHVIQAFWTSAGCRLMSWCAHAEHSIGIGLLRNREQLQQACQTDHAAIRFIVKGAPVDEQSVNTTPVCKSS